MSTSASGNASQIREQLDRYVDQFGGSGVYFNAAVASRAAVEEILKPESDKASFSITISGTVSESSGSINLYYSVTRPPQASADSSSASAPAPSVASAPAAPQVPADSVSTATTGTGTSTGDVSTATTSSPAPQSGSLTGATVDNAGAVGNVAGTSSSGSPT